MGETKPRFTPERIGGSDIWYIAENRKGFTADPEQAAKAPNGAPIAAPGEAMGISTVMLEKQMQLWEYLLDQMEKEYDLEEQLQTSTAEAGSEERNHLQSEIAAHGNFMAGIVDSLAVLEYGWTFGQEPEQARALIRQHAQARYNLSAEAV